jgi:ribose 5-phosphate isomerase A
MNQGKRAAALAALEHVKIGTVLGVGTGSTVNVFIDLLAEAGTRVTGAVASSEAQSSSKNTASTSLI